MEAWVAYFANNIVRRTAEELREFERNERNYDSNTTPRRGERKEPRERLLSQKNEQLRQATRSIVRIEFKLFNAYPRHQNRRIDSNPQNWSFGLLQARM